jgi:translation elongation factor EF-G
MLQSLAAIQAAVLGCDTEESAPTIVHVSKMVAVPASALPRTAGDPSPQDPLKEVFLAFGRVFAGQLKDGMSVHVLSGAYTPLEPSRHRQEVQVRMPPNRPSRSQIYLWLLCLPPPWV